jgi:hypothetical protein
MECIGGKNKRSEEEEEEEMIVPTQEELDEWIEKNPSGWDKGTIPRRWPRNWIYNDNYFSNYWPELETYDVEVILEDENEPLSVTPPREDSDSDSVPETVIVPDRPPFRTPPSVDSDKKKRKTKKSLHFTQ